MLILLGDSDFYRWPKSVLPKCNPSPINISQNGITLGELHQLFEKNVRNLPPPPNPSSQQRENFVSVFVCGGENDIAQGTPPDVIARNLASLLSSLASFLVPTFGPTKFFILGPKLEPWSDADAEEEAVARVNCTKLSKRFEAVVEDAANDIDVDVDVDAEFISCLHMFCRKKEREERAEKIKLGGIFTGATDFDFVDGRFFADDGLHLSVAGYEIWKEIIERKVQEGCNFLPAEPAK